MNRLERGLLSLAERQANRTRNDAGSVSSFGLPSISAENFGSTDAALKLSAVDRCVEALSDSLGKLPI